MPEEDEPSEEYNFKDWKVADLRDFASKNNIKIPTKSKLPLQIQNPQMW